MWWPIRKFVSRMVKKTYKRNIKLLIIIIFAYILLSTNIFSTIHGYQTTPLDISITKPHKGEYKIYVNNESFYVAMHYEPPYNFTWHDRENNTFNFAAGWAEESEIIPVLRNDFNLTAWDEKPIVSLGEFYYPYSHDYVLSNDSHTFLARYNGTFFEELLVYGHNSLVVDNIYGDRWNYTEHQLYDFYEYNHTTIVKVNSSSSKYNPTYAMYRAMLYLLSQHQDINKSQVGFEFAFLVPQVLLPSKYSNYSYLWVLHSWGGIRKDSNWNQMNSTEATTKPFAYISYILIDLNGNVVLDATKAVYYLEPGCGNCNSNSFIYELIIIAIGSLAVLSTLVVVIYKKHRKKTITTQTETYN